MNRVVRSIAQMSKATGWGGETPEREYRSEAMVVSSVLSLGTEPRLNLSWSVNGRYWLDRYTLLVFHNTAGFCTERYPEDLNKHGRLIIETVRDGHHEEVPPEGNHYFTFVLHKKTFLGLTEKLSVLRFSETVPSARVAISRIKDQIDLQDMIQKHEVGKIEYAAKLNEAEARLVQSRQKLIAIQNVDPRKKSTPTDALIAQEISGIDTIVESLYAKRRKVEELKSDVRFQELSLPEQQAVLERIEQMFDSTEIIARRELWGNP